MPKGEYYMNYIFGQELDFCELCGFLSDKKYKVIYIKDSDVGNPIFELIEVEKGVNE